MQGLMGTLVQCQPHFIRCIKPNPASQPGQLDPEYVLEQLRAGGVLEAVRIACAGFPTRKLFRCVQLSSAGCSMLMPADPIAAPSAVCCVLCAVLESSSQVHSRSCGCCVAANGVAGREHRGAISLHCHRYSTLKEVHGG